MKNFQAQKRLFQDRLSPLTGLTVGTSPVQGVSLVHGIDVDDQGNGTVTEQRMHQLIRQQKPITDRRFEIEFLDPGVEAFSFTFG